MLLLVVFIVLMLLWLFGMRRYGGGTLIPWICVAIVGYKVFQAYM